MAHSKSLRPLRRQLGVAAIELALLLPVLLTLMFGATELGRAIYSYNTLAKTVRDGVRHLSQHGPGDITIQAQARCLAVFGNLDCSGTPVAPGLTTGQIALCDSLSCADHAAQATGSGVVNLVSVSVVGYSFNSVVEFIVPDLNFNAIRATMRAQL